MLARIADHKITELAALFRGIGATRWLLPAPPDMAAPASAFTISRAAEMLGEDEEFLSPVGPGDEMDPRGWLPLDPWCRRPADHRLHACRMEYLRELLAEHKRNRSSPRS